MSETGLIAFQLSEIVAALKTVTAVGALAFFAIVIYKLRRGKKDENNS